MMKYNVKKIENTNTMVTTLTTSCKKRDIAISRFCRFLSEYDSCFKDSLLIALMTIHFDCIVDDSKQYKAVTETDEYYMTYTECGDVYQVTIDFKHDENTTTYKSLENTFVSGNSTKENDNETATDSADGNDNETATDIKDPVTIEIGSLDDVEIDLSQETATDSANSNETPNKTPAELKAEINKKYGVKSDSILNATEKHIVHKRDNEVYATSTKIIICDVCDPDEVCTITPYENGKELTTPIPKMKCLTCVIDYVKRLYALKVVTRETYFIISRDDKRNVVLTYNNTCFIDNYYKVSDDMARFEKIAIDKYGYYSKYTRRPTKVRQYDTLELYKNNIYLTISQCNNSENAVRNFWCNIIYKDVNHIGQYTYTELLHLIDNIRFNTQEYCDKYFNLGDSK